MKKILIAFMMTCFLFSCSQPESTTELRVKSQTVRAAYPQWSTGTAYLQGDFVVYKDNVYQCRQPHTAIDGWYPDSVPALWTYVEPSQPSAPLTPEGVTASAVSKTEISVSWNNSADALSYDLEADGTVISNAVSPYTHSGLLASTKYNYRVRAVNAQGASPWSALISATTPATNPLPNVPAGLRAQGASATSITVSWDSVAAASGYDLKVDGVIVNNAVSPYTHVNLTAGSVHTYSVRAVNAEGASAFSAEITAKAVVSQGFNKRALTGFWETWDATIHSAGHIPLNNINPEYNVICVAFPVILSDGTCILEDNMAPGEDVPEPHEIAQAQAAGKKVLLSIGGAAASINLDSNAAVDRFIATIIPRLEYYGYDGIDIDIEAGLVAGASMTDLSLSQTNLIRIINSITDHFGPDFMLTMAPETAYVTGGTMAYGGPWGAYLPIINAVRDKLSWLQMQYYNGDMYGIGGTSYPPGTVEGMVRQTEALIDGFQVAGQGFFQGLPQSKVAVGLPAITGAGRGYMPPADVHTALNQLTAKYPNLRGLMTWSVNWDASNGYEYANNHGPYLKALGDVQ